MPNATGDFFIFKEFFVVDGYGQNCHNISWCIMMYTMGRNTFKKWAKHFCLLLENFLSEDVSKDGYIVGLVNAGTLELHSEWSDLTWPICLAISFKKCKHLKVQANQWHCRCGFPLTFLWMYRVMESIIPFCSAKTMRNSLNCNKITSC